MNGDNSGEPSQRARHIRPSRAKTKPRSKNVDIYLSQNEKPVSPSSIDPDMDLGVTWSVFRSGNTDPNGIVDDLIFVVMGNCHGKKLITVADPLEVEVILPLLLQNM